MADWLWSLYCSEQVLLSHPLYIPIIRASLERAFVDAHLCGSVQEYCQFWHPFQRRIHVYPHEEVNCVGCSCSQVQGSTAVEAVTSKRHFV